MRRSQSPLTRPLPLAALGVAALVGAGLGLTTPWDDGGDDPTATADTSQPAAASDERPGSDSSPDYSDDDPRAAPVIVSKTEPPARNWTEVMANPAVALGRPTEDMGTRQVLGRTLQEAESVPELRPGAEKALTLRARTEGDVAPVLDARGRLQAVAENDPAPEASSTPDFSGLASAAATATEPTAAVVSRGEWDAWKAEHPDTELEAHTPGGRPDEEFESVGDDVLQPALDQWTYLARPFHALVAIDISGSMDTPVSPDGTTRMDVTSAAGVTAMQMFPDHDAVGLWEFSREIDGDSDHRELSPVMPLDSEEDGGLHRMVISRHGANLEAVPGGQTGLYDTTLAAFRSVRDDDAPDTLKTVILLTDGKNQDPGSITLDELVKTLEEEQDPENPVRIITIGISAEADGEVLRRISEATGGSTHLAESPTDIKDEFVRGLTGT